DVRKRGLVGEIIGVGRGEKNLKFAQRQGIIDRYVTKETDIPEGTDLLMMATPVQTTAALTKTLLPRLSPGCIVSDVGSVKAEIVRRMESVLPSNIQFVGGHPIAGGEQWSARAAKLNLVSRVDCRLA